MKVGLYNSSLENSSCGDVYAAVLASVLSQEHRTEIVSCPNTRDPEQFRKSGQSRVENISYRTMAPAPQLVSDPNRPDRRYEALRAWSHELTRPYDLFINLTDRLPVFSSARQSVLVIQFPYDFIPSFYQTFWLAHLHSYQLKIANSYYTQYWTRVFWEIDARVVHPPVPLHPVAESKDNLIVSFGRFDAAQPHRQLKLISAFKLLKNDLPTWSFSLIGDLSQNRSDQGFFAAVCDAARTADINVVANPTFDQETELLRRAKIIWLASEVEQELDFYPEGSHSFDLKLVQAMSTGCVPIVNNFGALSEVIRHRENGFFWYQLSELLERTLELAGSETHFQAMTRTARMRALDFRRDRFIDSFMKQLEEAFGISSAARTIVRLKRLFSAAGQFLPTRR